MVSRNILCYNGIGYNDCTITNMHARHNSNILTNPNIVADYGIALIR